VAAPVRIRRCEAPDLDARRPVGFASVVLNAFHERMGVVDMVAVDPPYQRRGIESS
jgi:ribosomal protein S18 acetylase RimI-like enzyme